MLLSLLTLYFAVILLDGFRVAARILPSHLDLNVTNNTASHTADKRSGGYVQAAYFTNWGIYGANFQPSDISTIDLTHVLYAFADVSRDTGTIFLTDSYADEQKHYAGDSWDEPGNNLYGCLKQLYLLKLSNRRLKVLLSIGGWTYSQSGHFSFVTNSGSRSNFVSSAVQLVKDYGFDGIDIDFEYPADSGEGQAFADLLTDLRAAFDELASSNGDDTPYELTAAVSAGFKGYANYVFSQMDAALTYWNLMAYDYAGSWLTWTDNQANLYGGERTKVNTDDAIKHYVASGATSSKINLGIPLYGRAFEATQGLGQPYNGIGPGTVQAGIYSYKYLPLAGAQVFEDYSDGTSYSYDTSKQEFVSYDTPGIVKMKVEYAIANDLAGSMFWELAGDKSNSNSLVQTSSNAYSSLDSTPNHINYPQSKWNNIRNNMGESPDSPPSSKPPPSKTTSAEPSPSSTPSSAPVSGGCSGVASWNSKIAYSGGQSVTYNDHLWTARWWTEADTPGGSSGAWVDDGPCAATR
ncbi:glycoside hydrolase family 18 protein [Hygrophoropsis aurantiaca]|uniref:Glycoside hydrolase family 18 protein n=1 Tax=Hygrophoropsis aurantiaca TaxID=72124 RepID=A0ACB8AF15_9AGAM|nr:glycoside hydrolase family 18 protein [Hygrophoropsis aurantiaca]